MLLNLPLSISSLIFAISPWAARKCRDGSEKENEQLKNKRYMYIFLQFFVTIVWSLYDLLYYNIAFLWPWNPKIEKINTWASLKVGSCLASGSWLTQAYVWLVKWLNSFGTGDIPQVRIQFTVLQMKNRAKFKCLLALITATQRRFLNPRQNNL